MLSTPRRILVTGANGFVGKHLVQALNIAFPEAVLYTRRVDVVDAKVVDRVVADFVPDVTVHLAGIAAVPQANAQPELAWSINLHGTLHLARSVLARSPNCRFLYISSGEIYGASFRPGQPVDETTPLAPVNTYAATKAAADLAVGSMVPSGLNSIRLRPFNHVGPGQSESFVVAAFARQVALIELGGQDPVIRVGALQTKRDFLDVEDVCAAYIACLKHPEVPSGRIYNIASGKARPTGDILEFLLRQSTREIVVETDAARIRPVDIAEAYGDSRRAQSDLDWTPRADWSSTLMRTLSYWRKVVREPTLARHNSLQTKF